MQLVFHFGTENRKNTLESTKKNIPGPGEYSDTYTSFNTKSKGGFIGKASRDDDWEYVTEEQYMTMQGSSARRKRTDRVARK